MLWVNLILGKGMEYGVDVNHFYDYHHEHQAESLAFPSSGVLLPLVLSEDSLQ